MEIVIFFFSLTASFLWAFIVWRRIYRLARYFQLEGYESKRYLRWFIRQPYERRYLLGSFLSVVANILIIGFSVYPIIDAEGLVFLLLFLVSMNWIFALLHLIFLPREHEIKQKFTPTQRATRLLATAEIISVVVSLVVSRVLSPLWGTSPQDSYIQSAAVNWFLSWISFGGALVVLLTPLSLPLANIINFPLEETFRQFYLARAKRYLKRSGATVIAITGSYGKTSTKHYLHHILDGRFRVLMTPKSYNTLLGISRVINDVLSKDVSYEYFIAETDAYFVGENARICKLVEPTIGIVMTVGPMHLERLGSMENIATAQYEVVQALPPDGAAFFNGDDPVVRDMAGRGYPQTTQFVTQKGVNGGRLEAINVQMTAEGLDFEVRDNQTGEQRSMHAPLYGDHNVTNILMAAAVAHYLGMSLTEIAMRVTTLQPAEHRLIRRVMPDGTILIDDTYSANPVGTQTALGVLALQQQSQNRVVVSSGMFELGAVSDQENHKLGERMAAVATDVILIGAAQTQAVKKGLDDCHFAPDRIHIVSSFNEAIAIYKGILRPGDALLMLTDLPDTYA